MTPQEFNEAFAVSQFLPGANIVNLAVIFGGRLHGAAGAGGRARGPACCRRWRSCSRSARSMRAIGDIEALQRVSRRRRGGGGRPDRRDGHQDGAAAAARGRRAPSLIAVVAFVAVGVMRLAAAAGAARDGAGFSIARRLVGAAMKDSTCSVTLAMHFAILSLFAIGGAMAVVPEMHRQVVEVYALAQPSASSRTCSRSRRRRRGPTSSW